MNILVLIVGVIKLFVLVNGYQGISNRFLSISTRIVGGKFAYPKQFPSYVHLDIRMNVTNAKRFANGLCGGALISNDYVLTAAHCIHLPKLKLINGKIEEIQNQHTLIPKLYAYFGVHDLRIKDQYQKILVNNSENFITHFNYDPVTLINDIALIHLPRVVVFNEFVHPIKLPSNVIDYYAGRIALASGFGITSSSNLAQSSILKYVSVTILPNILCNPKRKQLCTNGFGRRGTCDGDSGGPLEIQNGDERILVGISSHGSKNCEDGSPSYYIRVSEYINWIETIKIKK